MALEAAEKETNVESVPWPRRGSSHPAVPELAGPVQEAYAKHQTKTYIPALPVVDHLRQARAVPDALVVELMGGSVPAEATAARNKKSRCFCEPACVSFWQSALFPGPVWRPPGGLDMQPHDLLTSSLA